MNIRNLVSTSLQQAGLDESDFDLSVSMSATKTTIYTTVRKRGAFKSIHMVIGIADDNYVSDFMVSEENMSSVIGDEAYERFINRMTEETYIYV